MSFGEPFYFNSPALFPTGNFFIHSSNVTAPFWFDIDTRMAGTVSYETHQRGFNVESNAVLERVSGFIASQMNISFTASWMLLAHWDRVHPYPHGIVGNTGSSGPYQDYLNSVSEALILVLCTRQTFSLSKTGEHVSSCSHHGRDAQFRDVHLPVQFDGVVWTRTLCDGWLQPQWRLREPPTGWDIICQHHRLSVER